MKSVRLLMLFSLLQAVFFQASAQKITISEADKDDNRRMNFDIIGKMGNNYLIYKNIRGESYICVYDNDMKLVQKVKHEYLPDERMINVDFFPFSDHIIVIYEYQKRNVVHCKTVKLDGMGNKISDPIELDTSLTNGMGNNKIYSVLMSEDKQKILVYKINTRNKTNYLLTIKLYNNKLELLKSSRMSISMDDRHDYLGEFALSNDGDLVFSKYFRLSNESISNATLFVKNALDDTLKQYRINLDKIYLDELRVKVDNGNGRYLVSAFYYSQKRASNIEGLYFLAMNKNTLQPELEKTFVFSEDLRRESKGEANLKMAFNDYFIRNLVIKRDGGFLLDAESFYTTSRYSPWNRWDYMSGYPYSYPMDYYYSSPYYNNWRYWGGSNNQSVRYHADNVVIMSFDAKGNLEWSNVITKGQFDDESDERISFQVMNTGGQLHYLFNLQEKRALLLNDYALSPDGKLVHNPTLKSLDQGHEFMPKYGKQVSSRQFIVPCIYRNYICFAKIDFN